jgi:hypothetical protein
MMISCSTRTEEAFGIRGARLSRHRRIARPYCSPCPRQRQKVERGMSSTRQAKGHAAELIFSQRGVQTHQIEGIIPSLSRLGDPTVMG